jgi:hypothetical protein
VRSISESELTLTQRFLLRLARNELWLSGYDVRDLLLPFNRDLAVANPMENALVGFWTDHPDPSVRTKPFFEQCVDGPLFVALARERSAPLASLTDVADFITANDKVIDEAWRRAMSQTPVFFIWDGITRGLQWLGRQFQLFVQSAVNLAERSADYLKTLVWNVVRACYQPAAEALSVVRRACANFVKGWQLYLGGELRAGPAEAPTVWRLRPDGDLRVWVSPEACAEARQALKRFMVIPEALALTSLTLSDVVSLIAKAAGGPIGWVFLLAGLVQNAPALLSRAVALANIGDLPDNSL